MGTHRGRSTLLIATALIFITTAGAGECTKPSLAGCALGMTLKQVKTLIPNSSVTSAADGTKLLIGTASDPVPGIKLGPSLVKVSFDRSAAAIEVWLRAETELDEQKVLISAEAMWGKAESIHGSDGEGAEGRIYLMNARWSSRCGASPRLNVKVSGEPSKSTVNLGLQVGDE